MMVPHLTTIVMHGAYRPRGRAAAEMINSWHMMKLFTGLLRTDSSGPIARFAVDEQVAVECVDGVAFVL